MLLRFGATNFFSFKDSVEIDLVVPTRARGRSKHFSTRPEGEEVVRVAAILGPNASGKTNVLKVPTFLAHFLEHSFDYKPDQPIAIFPFFSNDCENEPSELFMEVDGTWKGKDFRALYELKLNSREVLYERVQLSPSNLGQLVRTGESLKTSGLFKIAGRDPVRKKVRRNASAISMLAQFEHDFALSIVRSASKWRGNVYLAGKHAGKSFFSASEYYHSNPQSLKAFKNFIAKTDLGIEDVYLVPHEVEKSDSVSTSIETLTRWLPMFSHRKLSQPVQFGLESNGTGALFRVLPDLLDVLADGGVALMDELDSDLHPHVFSELINLFVSDKTNPKNAQLLFVAHNPIILENLEKEEIFLVEKKTDGSSIPYRLSDVSGVDRNENFVRRYLSGRYGAIPNI